MLGVKRKPGSRVDGYVPVPYVLLALLVTNVASIWISSRRNSGSCDTEQGLFGPAAEATAAGRGEHPKIILAPPGQHAVLEKTYWQQRHDAEELLKGKITIVQEVYAAFAGFYPCPLRERVGAIADGGKWMCNIDQQLLDKPTCVIYSLGSAGETSFEIAMHKRFPQCVFHIFDPSLGDVQRAEVANVPNSHLHEMGIGVQDEASRTIDDYSGFGHNVSMISIASSMQKEGVQWIDVLKCDIEGYEFEVLYDYIDNDKPIPASVLLVEVHLHPLLDGYEPSQAKVDQLLKLMKGMTKLGWRIYNQEPNLYAEWYKVKVSNIVEFAFLNMDKEGHLLVGPPA